MISRSKQNLSLVKAVASRIRRACGGAIPTGCATLRNIIRTEFGLNVFEDYHRAAYEEGFTGLIEIEYIGEAATGMILYNPTLRPARLRRVLIHELAEFVALCYAPSFPEMRGVMLRYADGRGSSDDYYHDVAKKVENALL